MEEKEKNSKTKRFIMSHLIV